MAIDTAEKRRAASVISFYPLGPGVTPNASKDQEWRQEAGYGYPGILASGAPEPAAPELRHFVYRVRRRFNVRAAKRFLP